MFVYLGRDVLVCFMPWEMAPHRFASVWYIFLNAVLAYVFVQIFGAPGLVLNRGE